MNTAAFDDFSARALAQGYDEVLQREWLPDQVVATHTHPFAVQACVARGEFWLETAEGTRHLQAGDRFELPAGVPHAERYGAEGATFWVARRHPHS